MFEVLRQCKKNSDVHAYEAFSIRFLQIQNLLPHPTNKGGIHFWQVRIDTHSARMDIHFMNAVSILEWNLGRII